MLSKSADVLLRANPADVDGFRFGRQAAWLLISESPPDESGRTRAESPREHITQADTIIYRASQHDCTGCPLKQRCCPHTPTRKIARSVHERSREVARAIATTPQYKQSRRDRKKVEMLFAHPKRILKLDRLRLRGMSGAHDEFLLAATAQNLRRMAKRLFEGQQRTAAMPA